jgi:hypothetical protein
LAPSAGAGKPDRGSTPRMASGVSHGLRTGSAPRALTERRKSCLTSKPSHRRMRPSRHRACLGPNGVRLCLSEDHPRSSSWDCAFPDLAILPACAKMIRQRSQSRVVRSAIACDASSASALYGDLCPARDSDAGEDGCSVGAVGGRDLGQLGTSSFGGAQGRQPAVCRRYKGELPG